MPKKFQKRKEDFICLRCAYKNIGNGYTNHCSRCLYSQHVDVNPGDRLNTCGGLMEPTKIEQKGQKMLIVFKCQTCGTVHRNSISPDDNLDVILEIMKRTKI